MFDLPTFLFASNYKSNIIIKKTYLRGRAPPNKVLSSFFTKLTPFSRFSKSATPDSIPSGSFPVNSILNGAPF